LSFTATVVVGDAEFGDNATLRRILHRAKLAARARPTSPSTLDHRTAVTRRRTRTRSLRRPQPARVATPRGLDGLGLQLSPAGTPAAGTDAADPAACAAVIQEILTAHFFMTQPHYLKPMLKLKEIELRRGQSGTRRVFGCEGCELRQHAPRVIATQIVRDGELLIGQQFELRELVVQRPAEERKATEKGVA
jgi:hypothetical protein